MFASVAAFVMFITMALGYIIMALTLVFSICTGVCFAVYGFLNIFDESENEESDWLDIEHKRISSYLSRRRQLLLEAEERKLELQQKAGTAGSESILPAS